MFKKLWFFNVEQQSIGLLENKEELYVKEYTIIDDTVDYEECEMQQLLIESLYIEDKAVLKPQQIYDGPNEQYIDQKFKEYLKGEQRCANFIAQDLEFLQPSAICTLSTNSTDETSRLHYFRV